MLFCFDFMEKCCMNDFLRLLWSGKQDCEPLYKVGPYPRTCYILHYVLRGRRRIQAYGQ